MYSQFNPIYKVLFIIVGLIVLFLVYLPIYLMGLIFVDKCKNILSRLSITKAAIALFAGIIFYSLMMGYIFWEIMQYRYPWSQFPYLS